MAVETVDFEVLRKDGKFQLRKYREYLTASISMEADFSGALNSGFRILHDYFSGNNWSKTPIYIDGPVQGEKTRREKISMTTPVTVTTLNEGSKYLVTFNMPSKYTTANLPDPFNKKITFEQVQSYTAAAMTFRGRIDDVVAKEKASDLNSWLLKNGISAQSNFMFAIYNPLLIPIQLRHNEAITKLDYLALSNFL